MKQRTAATVLVTFMVLLASVAPEAQEDSATAQAEQDARDVLGDRAKEPDLASPTFEQSDNAGVASFGVGTQQQTHTESSSHHSSTSVGVGIDAGAAAEELVDALTHKHHEQSNPTFNGPVTTVNAGPIWNNDDAKGKCPNVCSGQQMGWTGNWRTVGFNKSVCDCAPGASPAQPQAGGPGSSCSARTNYQCAGCSVSCPAGQVAHCSQGTRGIFNGPDDTICPGPAKCECR